ncbi:CDP-glycerol glycerophosphotransferase family protein [Oceanobacillus caeni]|nr:CDP-glycerol glycerophosphotransferase family protein [Oceanobacillus caeni]
MSIIKRFLTRVRRSGIVLFFYKIAFHLIGLLPRNKKTIIFESFHGKQYSDNPRAIYEYIIEHRPEYDVYWSADRRFTNLFEENHVPYIKRFSLKWLLKMGTAKYWVINARLPLWIPKPLNTVYLQTWHGTPLKKLGIDIDDVKMPGTDTEKYRKNFLYEAGKWDYLISPNPYSTEIFKRAFGFNKQVIESGYPRNDFLIHSNNTETISKIKERNQLPLDKKVILYAPTWRDNEYFSKGKYKFNLKMDLEKMRKELGNEYIIILRLHYLVAENLDLTDYDNFVYDFSSYEDIRELYVISDILITDYSSVFFDYANLKRPMIFFVYDIENYRDSLRGFYFDFEEKAPGALVKTTEEILGEIKGIKEHGYQISKVTEEFYHRFCNLEDGKACERVVNEVFR